MTELIVQGAACRPNFGAAGRRRRTQVAIAMGVVACGLFLGFQVFHVAWPVRLLVGLPAAAGLISYLQVRRNTCVAHAATGSVEGEDFTLTKAEAQFAEASRKVAKTIYRDGVLGGLMAAGFGAMTGLLG